MGVQPNLVVGAVGLLVFVSMASVIASNWRDLAGLDSWDADVSTFTKAIGTKSTTMGPGSTRVVPFMVNIENVTSVHVRIEWRESTTASYTVTAALRDPQGRTVATQTGQGGTAGITIDRTLREAPESSSFEAREDAAPAEFDRRYPGAPQTAGVWNLTLQTDSPQPLPPGDVDVRILDFTVDYYRVTLSQRTTELVK